MNPAKIIIIRHAEKPNEPTNKNLSSRGYERAAALAEFISTNYPGIVALYASGIGPQSKSLRPQETIAPLATKLNLKLNTSFLKEEYLLLVREIQTNLSYVDNLVLICWEHQDIPVIAQALGASNLPSKWSDDRFDLVWILDYTTGSCQFSQRPQLLLNGDEDSII